MRAIIHDYATSNSPNGQKTHNRLQQKAQEPLLSRWFIPKSETQIMPEATSRGIFLPYPLLAVIVTLAIVLVSGLVTLEVQVNNLSTTLLLRDADQRQQIQTINDKVATLQVYVQNDREKIVRLETEIENQKEKPRAR